MKLFLKIFFILFLSEIALEIFSTVISQQTNLHALATVLHILIHLVSYPLVLIDRSWPFYAYGPAYLGFLLTVLNLLIQTAIIFLIIKQKRARRKV